MSWYDKLQHYFPEMKSRAHLEALLQLRGDVYHKQETEHVVLMYAEFDAFIFVDYLAVAPESRGQGHGQRAIEGLKAKGKPIVLDIEPGEYDHSYPEARRDFYARIGFRPAKDVGYRRLHVQDDCPGVEALYWCPDDETTEFDVYMAMRETYRRIHAWRGEEFYRSTPPAVERAVTFSAGADTPHGRAAVAHGAVSKVDRERA